MKIQRMVIEEAYQSLRSGPSGLSSSEAARRLAEYGPNELDEVRTASLAWRFVKGFTHFFAIILWVAATLVFVAEVHRPGEGMMALGCAISGVIVVNGVFSFWQEYRAENALRALMNLLPGQIKVLRDGVITLLPPSQLVLGDVIVLQEGDRIPGDARVIESVGLHVDNATVTGESLPVARVAEIQECEDLLESTNVLLAGTLVVSGCGQALVFATGGHSAFGEIARQTQKTGEQPSPLQVEVVRLSRIVAILALSLGVLFFLIGRGSGLSTFDNLMFAIGIIVANVPEGLLPTVTLALAMGSQRMARRNALIRHLPAVEALGSASVICTDKTGTLTMNRMKVRRVFLGGSWIEAAPDGLRRAAAQHPLFFEVARQCHDVKETLLDGKQVRSGDPMELALIEVASEGLPGFVPAPAEGGLPFDTTRMRMSTVHRSDGHWRLHVKGAPEMMLDRCRLEPQERARIVAAQEEATGQGLRVLALASRQVGDIRVDEASESGLEFLGLAALEDPPRPDVEEAIRSCREAGIRVIMLTGDHPHTALAVARRIGLVQGPEPLIVNGARLKHLSNSQLQLALDAPEILFSRVSADQKTRIVAALRRKGHVVAVTGDGVNDAPALKEADIGIAMGRTGTDVARAVADIVLLDDHFATIVAAIEEGRTVFANIRKFLTYILTSNIPEVVPYAAFVLFHIPLPLTVIQILAVDLGTDMLPALALGAEPSRPEVMRQPPRPRSERLIGWRLLARAYLWLGLLQAAGAMLVFFTVLREGGWQYGMQLGAREPLYLQATSACLATIVAMQVANLFACRDARRPSLGRSGASNPWLAWGLAAELSLILAVIYTPWGQALFGTAPLPGRVWLMAAAAALAFLVFEESRKGYVRWRWGTV